MSFKLDVQMDFIPKCYNDKETHVKFDPPIYVQRYCTAAKILKHPVFAGQIKKIIDFGCSEMKFFNTIKHNLPEVEHVLCVDVDEELLKSNAERTKPLLMDYVKRRPCPLVVEVYKGSVASRCECLSNTDAVVAIELIEHLHANVLDDLPSNVFGHIKPKLAVFTTPNSDINCIFPDLINGGFRHWDHKFEWSRKEFEDWAHNICERYPQYSAQFYGVGAGPDGLDHLGCVSQLALFLRTDMLPLVEAWNNRQLDGPPDEAPSTSREQTNSPSILQFYNFGGADDEDEYCPSKRPLEDMQEELELEVEADAKSEASEESIYLDYFSPEPSESDFSGYGSDEEYKLILRSEYPFDKDDRTTAQKVLDDAKFHLIRLEHLSDRFYDEENDHYRIPVQVVLELIGSDRTTFAELKSILVGGGYTVNDDDLIEIEPEIQHFSDSEDDGCESDRSEGASPLPPIQPQPTVPVTNDDELWD